MRLQLILGAALLLVSGGYLQADSAKARCDIYAKGSDQADKMIACVFSQRQGFVSINRSDGISHELTPNGDTVGNYHDQHDKPVYRQSGLGKDGLIFQFPSESIWVYWDASALDPQTDDTNYTAPFTTQDYDATTRLRCKAAGDSDFGSCPAGISRMDDGQASITVQSQLGDQFTLNFMTNYVNSTGGEVETHLEGDTWIVKTANGNIYEVPLAAIEGG